MRERKKLMKDKIKEMFGKKKKRKKSVDVDQNVSALVKMKIQK